MSGRYSRNKGARVERELVHHLNGLGYNAQRIPLSGMMKGYKHDVDVSLANASWKLEVKARKDLSHLFTHDAGILQVFSLPGERVVLVSSSFGWMFRHHPDSLHKTALTPKQCKQAEGLYKWQDGADILVLKQDRGPFIFVRFMGEWDNGKTPVPKASRTNA